MELALRRGEVCGRGVAQVLEDEESLLQRLLDMDDRDDVHYLCNRLLVPAAPPRPAPPAPPPARARAPPPGLPARGRAHALRSP